MTIYNDYGVDLMEEACADAEYFICGTEYEIEDVRKCTLSDFVDDKFFFFNSREHHLPLNKTTVFYQLLNDVITPACFIIYSDVTY